MKLKDMNSLLAHEVKDLLHAEKQLTRALPKMASAVNDQRLRKAIENHLRETEEHVQRLERVCSELGIAARGERCAAMEGLIAEGSELLEQDDADPAVRDAAIIAAAQRVEHYEIAGYGAARAFAQQLGLESVVELLQQTLDEEGAADKKLTEVAESSVNPRAMEAAAKR